MGDAREMVEVVVGVMKEEKTPVNFFNNIYISTSLSLAGDS